MCNVGCLDPLLKYELGENIRGTEMELVFLKVQFSLRVERALQENSSPKAEK